ncbi:hypothetical protein [Arthrobacter glacialis]|uniref:Uncharacterized protein n=1 Tax=Arthrobacter glacialis TaxID=1664 RepID=A0A2S3ZSU1_ARTGL|nr:hypothetical protein [Arthrobacter glacialis]POH72164.1 hypothetical protein CVS27_16860 [Arthrobacter glacialis]
MAEPEWFSVDEAARALKAYDQGSEVDPDVWDQDTPEVERQSTGAKWPGSRLLLTSSGSRKGIANNSEF